MRKIGIYHGVYVGGIPVTRKKNHYISMPLKLRKLLEKKAVKFNLDVVEFTFAQYPEKHIAVIAIVHPLDHFTKKVGIKIIDDRMNWAMKERAAGRNINHKSWAYELSRDAA